MHQLMEVVAEDKTIIPLEEQEEHFEVVEVAVEDVIMSVNNIVTVTLRHIVKANCGARQQKVEAVSKRHVKKQNVDHHSKLVHLM
jgi:hypothetical protein